MRKRRRRPSESIGRGPAKVGRYGGGVDAANGAQWWQLEPPPAATMPRDVLFGGQAAPSSVQPTPGLDGGDPQEHHHRRNGGGGGGGNHANLPVDAHPQDDGALPTGVVNLRELANELATSVFRFIRPQPDAEGQGGAGAEDAGQQPAGGSPAPSSSSDSGPSVRSEDDDGAGLPPAGMHGGGGLVMVAPVAGAHVAGVHPVVHVPPNQDLTPSVYKSVICFRCKAEYVEAEAVGRRGCSAHYYKTPTKYDGPGARGNNRLVHACCNLPLSEHATAQDVLRAAATRRYHHHQRTVGSFPIGCRAVDHSTQEQVLQARARANAHQLWHVDVPGSEQARVMADPSLAEHYGVDPAGRCRLIKVVVPVG